MKTSTVRNRGYSYFLDQEPETLGTNRHWLMRAHNFAVEWIELAPGQTGNEFESMYESLLIAEGGEVHIMSLQSAGRAVSVAVPDRAIAIVPAGRHRLSAPAGARLALIASQRADIQGRRVLNTAGCEPPDPRVLPAGVPFRRRQAADGVQVLTLAEVKASPDSPRLKMLQTETLSINLVEYEDARDRSELSPHSHSSFEQGSLAIAGNFIHHLRVPWGSDANQWREDEHLQARSPSLLVVPVEMVHTTEGVGEGRHFLVDVFSPPRKDFIAKRLVFNAGDYEEN